ncbi:MAG: 4-alpha-glucanotransferase [Lautropia sp.]
MSGQSASPAIDPQVLERLAAFAGIETHWTDAHGSEAAVGRETLVRVLAAMGIAADDDARAAASLASLEREAWIRPLPPVLVHREASGALAVPLNLRAGTDVIRWRIECEDGSVETGNAGFGTLPLEAETTIDGERLQRRLLRLPRLALPFGHHRFGLGLDGPSMPLIACPARCWLPDALADGGRVWGLAVQLYLLRSDTDWGIGDFGDLCSLVDLAAEHDAAVIGLNPLHALFTDAPEHASPYSPSSRLLLNPLNIDVMAIPEMGTCTEARALVGSEGFQRDLARCRASRLLDYTRVVAIKLPVLRLLFDACMRAPDGARRRAFEAFRRERGPAFERHCRYLALREHFAALDPARADWHAWPAEYQDAAGEAVERFAQARAQGVAFVAWLQWVADEQLAQAAGVAARRGLAVGLYRDLAIGSDRGGAETWASPDTVVSDAQVGAPPDLHMPAGQDWGLPPNDPRRLREAGYRDFIELLRANMRHAGALRIDHVMGLLRLWWVPRGSTPADGAYVHYPLEDLLGILALESRRAHCLVVGEDLGTVPPGLRERLAEAGVLSYRVLCFEQDAQRHEFVAPEAWPAQAIAVLGSHDLPTFDSWWEGRDLDLKARAGLFPAAGEIERQRDARERDRAALVRALFSARLLERAELADPAARARAAHAYIARTGAAIAMAQIDDLAGECDPVNLPGTSVEHPNWRRRQSVTLDELARLDTFRGPVAVLNAARGAGGTADLQRRTGQGAGSPGAVAPPPARRFVPHARTRVKPR